MAKILIEVNRVNTALRAQDSLIRALSKMASDTESVKNGLRAKIAAREAIERKLKEAVTQIEMEHEDIISMRGALEQISSLYVQTESRCSESLVPEIPDFMSSLEGGAFAGSDGQNPYNPGERDPLKWLGDLLEDLKKHWTKPGTDSSDRPTFWDYLKALLSYRKEFEDDKYAGPLKSFLGYMESIADFLKGDKSGYTGGEQLLDIGSSGSSFWKSLIILASKFDKTATADYVGDFLKQWGPIGAAAGISGSLFALCSKLLHASNPENTNIYDVIGDYVDAGGEAADLFKNILDVKNLGKVTESSAGKYAIVVESFCSCFSQGVKSYGKYSADGTYDVGDIGATCVDASVEGLFSFVKGLTRGVVSEDTLGVSPEEVSESMKGWAADRGNDVAQWIKDTPGMQEKYDNASPAGKNAMILWAMVCSAF